MDDKIRVRRLAGTSARHNPSGHCAYRSLLAGVGGVCHVDCRNASSPSAAGNSVPSHWLPGQATGGSPMKLAATVCPDAPPVERTRIADYVQLAKPRLSVMALLTV